MEDEPDGEHATITRHPSVDDYALESAFMDDVRVGGTLTQSGAKWKLPNSGNL